MKEVKVFLISELIMFVLKVVGGLLCHSVALLTCGIYDLVLIVGSFFVLNKKENSKVKGIISSIVGLLFILVGVLISYISLIGKNNSISFFIILFLFLSLLTRYIISCFYTNINYQRHNGLLSFGNINSNMDFYTYGVILVSLILSKLSKWVGIFKYADKLATLLIAVLIIYKGLLFIINSFKVMNDKEIVIKDEVIDEINGRSEVKKLDSLTYQNFGGIRKLRCRLQLNNGISLIDINTFVVTLQDYLLKYADYVFINLEEKHDTVKRKAKVRSLKQDARNSRSGNGKTNTKKKNSKKRNK